jgi:hypothetical protein
VNFLPTFILQLQSSESSVFIGGGTFEHVGKLLKAGEFAEGSDLTEGIQEGSRSGEAYEYFRMEAKVLRLKSMFYSGCPASAPVRQDDLLQRPGFRRRSLTSPLIAARKRCRPSLQASNPSISLW